MDCHYIGPISSLRFLDNTNCLENEMSRMTILSQWAQAAAKPAFQMSQSLIKVLYKQTFAHKYFLF